MSDTHEKVKNALSNGAEETPAEPEVMEIEATPTPHVPLIGGDYNNVQFGPVKPPAKQPLNYMPTFGRQPPRDESSSDEDLPLKKPASKSKKTQVCAVLPPSLCTHINTCHCAGP